MVCGWVYNEFNQKAPKTFPHVEMEVVFMPRVPKSFPLGDGNWNLAVGHGPKDKLLLYFIALVRCSPITLCWY